MFLSFTRCPTLRIQRRTPACPTERTQSPWVGRLKRGLRSFSFFFSTTFTDSVPPSTNHCCTILTQYTASYSFNICPGHRQLGCFNVWTTSFCRRLSGQCNGYYLTTDINIFININNIHVYIKGEGGFGGEWWGIRLLEYIRGTQDSRGGKSFKMSLFQKPSISTSWHSKVSELLFVHDQKKIYGTEFLICTTQVPGIFMNKDKDWEKDKDWDWDKDKDNPGDKDLTKATTWPIPPRRRLLTL